MAKHNVTVVNYAENHYDSHVQGSGVPHHVTVVNYTENHYDSTSSGVPTGKK
jgi:hypothetical protein